jgi:LacI family transcriptional regulator
MRDDHSIQKPGLSIQDVAAAAEVSIATVSRVLNNPAMVSPKTIARVQEVIKRLGYVPNPFARGLITRESRVLGIALPDIHGEFYSELLRGADAEARRLGYHLLVSSEGAIAAPAATTSNHAAPPAPSAPAPDAAPTAHPQRPRGEHLVFGLIDGLAVMITEPNERLRDEIRHAGVPTVVLDADLNEPGVDSIVIDNATGTREAVAHLLTKARPESCYFVGGPRENFDTQQRFKVFTETLGAHSTATPPTVRPDQAAFGRYAVEWGREWAAAAVGSAAPNSAALNSKGGKANRLIGAGILAGNDEIALGIMQVAQRQGLRVGQDVSIIGFDDTRLAQLVSPTLTTVRVPLLEAGAEAIKMLVRRVENPKAETLSVHLATKLIVRES